MLNGVVLAVDATSVLHAFNAELSQTNFSKTDVEAYVVGPDNIVYVRKSDNSTEISDRDSRIMAYDSAGTEVWRADVQGFRSWVPTADFLFVSHSEGISAFAPGIDDVVE